MNTAVSSLMPRRDQETPLARPLALPEEVLETVRLRLRKSPPGSSEALTVQGLCDAIVADTAAFELALTRLRMAQDLTDSDVVDRLIPEMARQLGEDWTDNRRGFADVTVGTCRLMAVLRRVAQGWAADSVMDWQAPQVAMVAPRGEQHLLGMLVVSSRFRRAGVSVQMLAGREDAEIVATVQDGGFDAVALSIATEASLEPAEKLIKMLRQQVADCPPVIAGGAICADPEQIRARLGADHFTSDPDEALRLCLNRAGTRQSGDMRSPA